jgi:ABC-2 type transport system ATP-binding protein
VNELFAQSKIIKLQLSSPVSQSVLSNFGQVKEYSDFAVTLQVNRQDLRERSKVILDQLPVIDFTIADIPVEEGIALLYQQQETVHGTA